MPLLRSDAAAPCARGRSARRAERRARPSARPPSGSGSPRPRRAAPCPRRRCAGCPRSSRSGRRSPSRSPRCRRRRAPSRCGSRRSPAAGSRRSCVRSSLVRSFASLTAPAASRPRWIVTACASWVSQSGTVLTSVELILVTRLLSFSCTSRIDGSDCIVTCRVSFRSCTRRSRSSRAARRSRSSCASITPCSSGAACTSASLAGMSLASSSASLRLAGGDVERQLVVEGEGLLVELVERLDVLQERVLVRQELAGDLVDLALHLLVARHEARRSARPSPSAAPTSCACGSGRARRRRSRAGSSPCRASESPAGPTSLLRTPASISWLIACSSAWAAEPKRMIDWVLERSISALRFAISARTAGSAASAATSSALRLGQSVGGHRLGLLQRRLGLGADFLVHASLPVVTGRSARPAAAARAAPRSRCRARCGRRSSSCARCVPKLVSRSPSSASYCARACGSRLRLQMSANLTVASRSPSR